MKSTSPQCLQVYTRIGDRVVISKCQCTGNEELRGALPAYDLHCEQSDPPRPRFTAVSLTNNEFGDFGLRLELGRELHEKEDANRLPRGQVGKRGALNVLSRGRWQ